MAWGDNQHRQVVPGPAVHGANAQHNKARQQHQLRQPHGRDGLHPDAATNKQEVKQAARCISAPPVRGVSARPQAHADSIFRVQTAQFQQHQCQLDKAQPQGQAQVQAQGQGLDLMVRGVSFCAQPPAVQKASQPVHGQHPNSHRQAMYHGRPLRAASAAANPALRRNVVSAKAPAPVARPVSAHPVAGSGAAAAGVAAPAEAGGLDHHVQFDHDPHALVAPVPPSLAPIRTTSAAPDGAQPPRRRASSAGGAPTITISGTRRPASASGAPQQQPYSQLHHQLNGMPPGSSRSSDSGFSAGHSQQYQHHQGQGQGHYLYSNQHQQHLRHMETIISGDGASSDGEDVEYIDMYDPQFAFDYQNSSYDSPGSGGDYSEYNPEVGGSSSGPGSGPESAASNNVPGSAVSASKAPEGQDDWAWFFRSFQEPESPYGSEALRDLLGHVSPKFAVKRPANYIPVTPSSIASSRYARSDIWCSSPYSPMAHISKHASPGGLHMLLLRGAMAGRSPMHGGGGTPPGLPKPSPARGGAAKAASPSPFGKSYQPPASAQGNQRAGGGSTPPAPVVQVSPLRDNLLPGPGMHLPHQQHQHHQQPEIQSAGNVVTAADGQVPRGSSAKDDASQQQGAAMGSQQQCRISGGGCGSGAVQLSPRTGLVSRDRMSRFYHQAHSNVPQAQMQQQQPLALNFNSPTPVPAPGWVSTECDAAAASPPSLSKSNSVPALPLQLVSQPTSQQQQQQDHHHHHPEQLITPREQQLALGNCASGVAGASPVTPGSDGSVGFALHHQHQHDDHAHIELSPQPEQSQEFSRCEFDWGVVHPTDPPSPTPLSSPAAMHLPHLPRPQSASSSQPLLSAPDQHIMLPPLVATSLAIAAANAECEADGSQAGSGSGNGSGGSSGLRPGSSGGSGQPVAVAVVKPASLMWEPPRLDMAAMMAMASGVWGRQAAAAAAADVGLIPPGSAGSFDLSALLSPSLPGSAATSLTSVPSEFWREDSLRGGHGTRMMDGAAAAAMRVTGAAPPSAAPSTSGSGSGAHQPQGLHVATVRLPHAEAPVPPPAAEALAGRPAVAKKAWATQRRSDHAQEQQPVSSGGGGGEGLMDRVARSLYESGYSHHQHHHHYQQQQQQRQQQQPQALHHQQQHVAGGVQKPSAYGSSHHVTRSSASPNLRLSAATAARHSAAGKQAASPRVRGTQAAVRSSAPAPLDAFATVSARDRDSGGGGGGAAANAAPSPFSQSSLLTAEMGGDLHLPHNQYGPPLAVSTITMSRSTSASTAVTCTLKLPSPASKAASPAGAGAAWPSQEDSSRAAAAAAPRNHQHHHHVHFATSPDKQLSGSPFSFRLGGRSRSAGGNGEAAGGSGAAANAGYGYSYDDEDEHVSTARLPAGPMPVVAMAAVGGPPPQQQQPQERPVSAGRRRWFGERDEGKAALEKARVRALDLVMTETVRASLEQARSGSGGPSAPVGAASRPTPATTSSNTSSSSAASSRHWATSGKQPVAPAVAAAKPAGPRPAAAFTRAERASSVSRGSVSSKVAAAPATSDVSAAAASDCDSGYTGGVSRSRSGLDSSSCCSGSSGSVTGPAPRGRRHDEQLDASLEDDAISGFMPNAMQQQQKGVKDTNQDANKDAGRPVSSVHELLTAALDAGAAAAAANGRAGGRPDSRHQQHRHQHQHYQQQEVAQYGRASMRALGEGRPLSATKRNLCSSFDVDEDGGSNSKDAAAAAGPRAHHHHAGQRSSSVNRAGSVDRAAVGAATQSGASTPRSRNSGSSGGNNNKENNNKAAVASSPRAGAVGSRPGSAQKQQQRVIYPAGRGGAVSASPARSFISGASAPASPMSPARRAAAAAANTTAAAAAAAASKKQQQQAMKMAGASASGGGGKGGSGGAAAAPLQPTAPQEAAPRDRLYQRSAARARLLHKAMVLAAGGGVAVHAE